MPKTLRRAYAHLCSLQMQTELDGWEAEQREPIRGGWCFSDGEHRWPVSDCTAEAVCALLSLHYEGVRFRNPNVCLYAVLSRLHTSFCGARTKTAALVPMKRGAGGSLLERSIRRKCMARA